MPADYRARGLSFAPARPEDDAILRQLLRDNPMDGWVRLGLEREPGYQAGAPAEGRWSLLLSSDAPQYGGSGYGLVDEVRTEPTPWQHQPASFHIDLPPLGAVVLAHEPD